MTNQPLSVQILADFSKPHIVKMAEMIAANEQLFAQMYGFLGSSDNTLSWRTAWVCTELCKKRPEWFVPHRADLVKKIVKQNIHPGTRRLLLNVLLALPDEKPINVSLLNYCLDHMFSHEVPIAEQSVCIKLAYRLCLQEPELLNEFFMIVDDAAPHVSAPAVLCAIKNIKKKQV